MSATRSIPANVVETVLGLIVPFILPFVHNDLEAARATAWQMLDDYKIRTAEEFRLAGQVVSFSLQVLKALANAANSDLSFAQVCRCHAAAVSLKRAEVAAQRKLDALLKAAVAEAAAELETEAVEIPAPQSAAPDALVQLSPEAAEPGTQAAPLPRPATESTAPALVDRARSLVQAAGIATKANNPTHARQLAEAARKASLTQRIMDGHRRKAEADRQALACA